MANIAWGEQGWGQNKWGGQLDVSFSVTGFEATTSLGNVEVFIANVAEPTGVSATTTLSFNPATNIKIPISFSVTGVSATVGFLSGWGSSAWDAGVWGGGVFADVGQVLPMTGVEGTGQSNNPTVSGTASFAVTGVQASGELGDEGTVPQNLVAVTLPAMTGSVGNTVETGTGTFSLTGNSAETLIAGTSSSTITFAITVVGGNPSNHPYYNFGSANKFAINGSTATADVTLELYEGNTYRFDQSDSSNSGHPLRFSTTANGTHGGGSEYTTGVTTNGTPGSAGAYTEITVAAGAPTLYYFCTNHSGMGWQANTPFSVLIVTTTGAPTTGVVGTTALGDETVVGTADVAVTLSGLSISVGTLALTGTSVLSLTGVSATGRTGEEQIYSIIEPDQLANWIERVA
tara:strand:+ start:5383 stop:6591 length:1209 start_codon:yes stop_codon:yes gene_type:complete